MPRGKSRRRIPPAEFFRDREKDTRRQPPDETVRRPPHQPESESDSEEEEARAANLLREERRAAYNAKGVENGWVAGEFGYAGDPDGIQATSRACCSPCEKGWCDTIMGRCSLAQQTEIGPVKQCHVCSLSDDGRTWQPDRLHKKKCLKNNEAFDDNDNAKYIHYTGGGAIQSYLAGSEPQRDYTWNVAQFNGDEDDFGAAQHILELSMRYDDFGDEDEADHRRVLQRRIIDAYHHPNRRVWETLLRWMRSRPIGVEQQLQQQRQPPPPPPEGQVAMPAAGGKRHKKKTQKRKRRKKKTRGRKKRKGSRKRKRRKNRTYKKLKKRH